MGLDIGSSSIRLLQLSRHGNSYKVDHFAIEPLPSGVIVEKSVQDIDAISDAIQSAVRNSGSSSKYCAVAVSGSAVFTKTISLPSNLADADIESQVQIEANQYIPYPLDEISLDFEVIGPSPKNADMVDILLAASKNENVESRQDALESLGLKAKVVDVESFAIANAFELIRERDGIRSAETVGIFDVGSDLSRLLILRNGRVIYTRDHPFGGNQLTEEIMRRYEMSAEQAQFFMRGEPGPDNFEEDVLEPYMLSIVQQISRALQFYSSSAEFSNVRTMYLSGTMASLKGLAGVVEQELGIKTSIADPVAGMELAPSVAVSALKRNAPSLMVAAGLALRGFD
ncbi:MAG: pilus assembly protein PilM [Xanthomonadales bacterium]|jgi:type IV pilus assembly protein PilM|nr:pilus assembly protein PilM [Xanthomonadales bacterium]